MARLLKKVEKENPVTHRILQLLLDGYSISEIKREVNIAQNAVNNRIRKCRKIIKELIGEN